MKLRTDLLADFLHRLLLLLFFFLSFFLSFFHPDIPVMVDWALTINYLSIFFLSCFYRPDITFAVDWALQTNYPSFCLCFLLLLFYILIFGSAFCLRCFLLFRLLSSSFSVFFQDILQNVIRVLFFRCVNLVYFTLSPCKTVYTLQWHHFTDHDTMIFSPSARMFCFTFIMTLYVNHSELSCFFCTFFLLQRLLISIID